MRGWDWEGKQRLDCMSSERQRKCLRLREEILQIYLLEKLPGAAGWKTTEGEKVNLRNPMSQ